jgi:hypothetical protein
MGGYIKGRREYIVFNICFEVLNFGEIECLNGDALGMIEGK